MKYRSLLLLPLLAFCLGSISRHAITAAEADIFWAKTTAEQGFRLDSEELKWFYDALTEADGECSLRDVDVELTKEQQQFASTHFRKVCKPYMKYWTRAFAKLLNRRRLRNITQLGDLPPVEYQQVYYRDQQSHAGVA